MRSPTHTAFFAVFHTELLLNSKRIAPYALMIIFSANAALWTIAGPAVHYGWATNSDFYIRRNFGGFVFGILGLPIFTALIMADPVIRDFRLGVVPLIFSKPLSRAAYLLGKFCGSFFVLVCCQATFALTMLFLQVFHTAGMVVLPFRMVPYFKHFFLLVVVSYLLFAAVYFTVGTLTRNARIVYGLAVAYYPLYIAWQVLVLKNLPQRWRTILDPVLTKSSMETPWGQDAAWVNQIVVSYTPLMLANRGLVILSATVCLTVLYFRFSMSERAENAGPFSLLDLSPSLDRIHYDRETLEAEPGVQVEASRSETKQDLTAIPFGEVNLANEGLRAGLSKLVAATNLELRLLRSEKSLIVVIPLAVLVAFLSLPFSAGVSEVSYSASFAGHTANGLLLFLLGVIVFYTGEAIHRDREVRVASVLWSVPAPNYVFLLSKFLSTFLLVLLLVVLVCLTAISTQILRNQMPVEISSYLVTYSVIVVPSLGFITAASVALNVLLRDKYLCYAVSIAAGSGLFYLYSQGYNHWLYNPVLYGLWTEGDLAEAGSGILRLLSLRVYCLAITLLCLLMAHLRFERRQTRRFSNP